MLVAKKILKAVAVISYIIIIGILIFFSRSLGIDELLSYSPESKVLAIIFMLALFALKSLSIVFPIIVLQIASGILFPVPLALAVNLIGTAIGFALPYYVGMFLGADAAQKRIEKNEKLKKVIEKQKSNEFFLSFFLRVISCLPSDLVSMYLGLLKFRFPGYMLSSMLGALPGIIPATLMGKSIKDPLSPEFMAMVGITLFCSIASMVYYWFYIKKNND